MEYREFLDALQDEIRKRLGDDYTVTIREVTKNNSKKYDCIYIMPDNENISPAIYVDTYYKEYQMGRDLESVVIKIIDFYFSSKADGSNRLYNLSDIDNYDKVKERIVARMVNRDMNEEMLLTCPHKEILDFAITFHYLVPNSEKSHENEASVRINDEIFNLWNVDFEEFANRAFENTIRLEPPTFTPMAKVLDRIASKLKFVRNEVEKEIRYKCDAFVLSNNSGFYGSTAMLYNGLLREIASAFDDNLLLLPSSVHEMLVVRFEDKSVLPQYLKMVEQVNDTQLEVTDLLSYNIYVYDKNEDKIKIYPADFL